MKSLRNNKRKMLNPPSLRKEWRFWLKWTAMGIIAASIIALMRYHS